ncbi:NAD(P)-binding protein [Penicillium diatomitis]|uniref:NAD(P)-binding protein n=1 Tax=Penicillium diatomitis TaxID=2819901 RepID=A0A9W9XH97_9EURO|nr:NAD(P)-binding protein [Penicillium diatomitis]KAJ5491768.1 NAD(P)-binding protein [Penicillium diatomitis]
MSNPTINKVAIFGVTIITRAESTSTFPRGLPVIRIRYTLEDLTTALAGQDAAICAVGPGGVDSQVTMIEAAEAAGVKRFIVNDFGWGPDYRSLPEFRAPHLRRRAGWDCARAKAETNPNFTFTGITSGNPIDWAIKKFPLMGFDIAQSSATIYDTGTENFTGTTLAGIGQSVVGVLQHPSETSNRFVKVLSIKTNQNELLEAFQRSTGQEWSVRHASVQDVAQKGRQKFQAGLGGWALEMVVAQMYDEGQARCVVAPSWEESDAPLLGVENETAEGVVAKVLQS